MDPTPSPRILMCPPEYYGIQYEINPWMSRRRQADQPLARQQWTRLRNLLQSLGAEIELVDPQPGLPDMVFTANAGLVYRQRVVLSRFRHRERQGEEPHFEQWFSQHGYVVEKLPPGMFFEGAGDALFYRRHSGGGLPDPQ